jgi:osmotically-inducible protein OsmY
MRTVLRSLLLATLLVVIAFFAFGWWSSTSRPVPGSTGTTGTTGSIDVEKARERAAEVGERAAVATARVRETVDEAGTTAKIKAKLMLDDYVKARAIDISTDGSTVTLSGEVASADEHDRAIRIARETAGVTSVIDHLSVSAR